MCWWLLLSWSLAENFSKDFQHPSFNVCGIQLPGAASHGLQIAYTCLGSNMGCGFSQGQHSKDGNWSWRIGAVGRYSSKRCNFCPPLREQEMKYLKYDIQMILNLIIENHRRSELVREDGIIVRIWEHEEVFALKGNHHTWICVWMWVRFASKLM